MPVDAENGLLRDDLLDTILPLWTEERIAAAYQGWHAAGIRFFRPVTDALLKAGGVQPGMHVLDVGTGTGIPALVLAEVVGPEGKVVASDPSAPMIAAVASNASVAGTTNVECVRAVVEALPFPDGTFDVVVSQAGIMFASDLPRALSEIARVTRRGGRVAFSAWGRVDENPWLTGFWGAVDEFRERLQPSDAVSSSDAPLPPPDPRNPFRFAEPGSLSDALRRAGLQDVAEEHLTVWLRAPGRGEALLEFYLNFSRFEEEIPRDLRSEFRERVLSNFAAFADGDEVSLPARIVIASGNVGLREGSGDAAE